MGLGAPKRRTKLSHDPNNNTWSRSTDTYGHKILSAQGWKPGDYLGAENAAHAAHFTAANASHVKVLLREDNLGLGAQIGKSNAETFGLSLFSGVLGRLNGKSDAEIEKQQQALRDAEARTYYAQKYGLINFVRGGYLVGDEIITRVGQSLLEKREDSSSSVKQVEHRTKKKRKIDHVTSVTDETDRRTAKKIKQDTHNTLEDSDSKRSRKDKRKKSKSKGEKLEDKSIKRALSATLTVPQDIASDSVAKGDDSQCGKDRVNRRKTSTNGKHLDKLVTKDERSRKRQEKLARKEARAQRRERRKQKEDQESPPPALERPTKDQEGSGNAGGRHAVRQRYIQQKRMAALDPQALREIFMLKGAA